MMKRSVIGLCLLLASCTAGPCAKKTAQQLPDTFVWNNYGEPRTLDPAIISDFSSLNVTLQLFDGLTEYDPKTLAALPSIATSWDVSPDGRSYTFHLRSGVQWSDGTPLTATDFEYSWKRALDPATASEYAFMLYVLQGGEAFNTGKGTADAVGVKAVNPTTLEVTLTNPVPFFPHLVGFTAYRPVPRKTVEQWGVAWVQPEHIVVSGAYRLTTWIPQKEIVIEKNPQYWNAASVQLARAKFLPAEDRETALKLHLSGAVSYSEDLPFLKVPELSKRPDYASSRYLSTQFVTLNLKRAPLGDIKVRQALNLAIDRTKITELLNRGDHPATSFTPAGITGYTPPAGPDFDPVKAKALLAAAGFTDSTTFPKLTFIYANGENNKLVVELCQHMWKENLGIDVDVQSLEYRVLVKAETSRDYDIALARWIGDYLDPQTFLGIFASTSGMNLPGWSNPEYDDLITKRSAAESNGAQRFALLQQAETILLDAAPIVTLYHFSRPYLLDPRVKGVYGNPLMFHPLKFASFATP